jgi:chaperonin GroEL
MSGYDAHRFALEVTATKAQIIAELNKYSELIHSMEEIEAVLRSALVDPILAKVVAEILDTVGPEGAVKVEETRLPDLAHEYVRGGRWTTKIASPYLLDSTETVVTLHDPLIAVSTAPLVNVDGIILALEAATATKSRNLILLAPKFSDQVISALLLNRERGVLNVALAVLVPTSAHFGEEILVDIGMLVGAGFDVLNAPHASGSIRTEALGGAAEVWASRSAFGVIEGKGGPQALSARIRTLRNQIAVEENAVKRRQLRERIGTLQGIGAIIRAPSRTASFRDDRVTKVEKAIAIARQALQQGVLPGGGAALAHCAAELGSSEPQPIGSRVLLQAISEPMSVILENSDYHPGPILDQLSSKNWHDAFDVTSGVWVDTREAGLLDTLVSTKVALETAVSVALMVISTDTLVSRKAAQHYPRPRKARA